MKTSNRIVLTPLFLIFTLLAQFIGAAAQDGGDIVGGASGDIAGGSSVFVFKGRKKAQERNSFRTAQVIRTVQARVKDRRERVAQSKLLVRVIPKSPARLIPKSTTVKELQKIEGAAQAVLAANQYLKQNNLEEAETGFYEATQLDPENTEAKAGMAAVYAARGDAAYEKQDYERAIQLFEKANTFDSANADVYASLGDSYDALKQPEKAVTAYETALRLRKELTTLIAPLGVLYATIKNYEKSADYLAQALKVSPDDTKLRDTYGLVLSKLNRDEEARKALLKALELNSKNPESYYHLGEVYDRLNDKDKAASAYRSAIAINPKYKEAFFNLGVAHYNRGQYAEAAQNYDQAVRLQGDYVEARLNLADTYRQLCDDGDKKGCDSAINQYRVAVSLLERPQTTAATDASSNASAPNLADVHNKLGYCLGRNRQWIEAISQMKKAVAKQPDAVNYTNLAWAYNGSKDFASGKQAALEAVKLNPNFPAAYFNLGNAEVQSGQYAEAEKSFQQALRLKKDWADALNNLGYVYGMKKDWQKAADAHRAAAAADPKSVAAHLNLGLAAIALGDKKTAEQQRDALLQLKSAKGVDLDNLIKKASFDKKK